jgi:hypothetical protein
MSSSRSRKEGLIMRKIFVWAIIVMGGILGAGTVYSFIKDYPNGDQLFFALGLFLMWSAFSF